jgi:hypothetical protein
MPIRSCAHSIECRESSERPLPARRSPVSSLIRAHDRGHGESLGGCRRIGGMGVAGWRHGCSLAWQIDPGFSGLPHFASRVSWEAYEDSLHGCDAIGSDVSDAAERVVQTQMRSNLLFRRLRCSNALCSRVERPRWIHTVDLCQRRS